MKTPQGWSEKDNMLIREFEFENYVEVVQFIVAMLPLAEKENHHPDFQVYGYKHLRITLCTHDAGNTITEKDLRMAELINELM